jgi:hypothetical protein
MNFPFSRQPLSFVFFLSCFIPYALCLYVVSPNSTKHCISPLTVTTTQSTTYVPFDTVIIQISFNFCEEYDTTNINNIISIQNKTLLISPYDCSRTVKIQNIQKLEHIISGAIMNAFGPGLEIHMEPVKLDSSILFVSLGKTDFFSLQSALVDNAELNAIMFPDGNPYEVLFTSPATTVFQVVFTLCYLAIIVSRVYVEGLIVLS